jgi:Fe-S-cluster containining protein
MARSYLALRQRVDRISESIEARYGEQIACRPTCDECCRAGLTLVLVEAAVIGESLGIAEERIHLQAGQPPLREKGPCAMLTDDRLCLIYKNHPIICRTHGFPLRYDDHQITVCYQNFLVRIHHESAIIDMEDINTALFNANFDYCRQRGLNPMARVALDRIHELAQIIKKRK